MKPTEDILNDAIKETFLRFEGEKTGHGEDHTMRVYKTAEKLLEDSLSSKADSFAVLLSCLRHDWDDVKLFKEEEPYQHAKEFLRKEEVPLSLQEKILSAIETVSFKGKDSVKPETLEGEIIQDADRLDAIGAIGIARAFQYGGSKGRKIYDMEETIPLNPDEKEYRSNTLSTVAHFYQKLLQIEGLRNTPRGKKEAHRRTLFRKEFLMEREEEVGSPLYKALI